MRVLLISPPSIPVYVNNDYTFTEIGEIAGYLDKHEGVDLTVSDFSMLNGTWDDVLELLLKDFDVLIIHNTMENYQSIEKLVLLSRAINPSTPIATYGRLGVHMKKSLMQLNINMIVIEQDWEISLSKFCDLINKGLSSTSIIPGAYLKIRKNEYVWGGLGEQLNDDWSLPLVSKLPINDYLFFKYDKNPIKSAGKNLEFAISMSRGCDDKCGYCPIPKVNGRHERFRQSVENVAKFANKTCKQYGMKSLSLFSANFTKSTEYVEKFCEAMKQNTDSLPWKCVTSPKFLDEQRLEIMSSADCQRIAIGVESFLANGSNIFPWREDLSQIKKLVNLCKNYSIKLVAFVMVGIPKQTKEDLIFTLKSLEGMGAFPRPMIYINYNYLKNDDNSENSFWFNRKIINYNSKKNQEFSYRELMEITRSWQNILE